MKTTVSYFQGMFEKLNIILKKTKKNIMKYQLYTNASENNQ